MGWGRNSFKVLVVKPEGNSHVEDLVAEGRLIVK